MDEVNKMSEEESENVEVKEPVPEQEQPNIEQILKQKDSLQLIHDMESIIAILEKVGVPKHLLIAQSTVHDLLVIEYNKIYFPQPENRDVA